MNIQIEILLTSFDQFSSGHMDFLNGSEGILMVTVFKGPFNLPIPFEMQCI